MPCAVDKERAYLHAIDAIESLTAGEDDEVAVMATVACELRVAVPYASWVGFYRVFAPGLLKIGPYQGGHGCLTIPFDRGVCGAAARLRATQVVPDVRLAVHHIACSSATLSEIVVPLLDAAGETRAVLDLDSEAPAAFDAVDRFRLEQVCELVARRIGWLPPPEEGA
ncbi:MAG: GAF domain-containing protein [Armatimonadetes bacterium]|nr:GAF domain-containing protein [Armatimonadota bacterium]